MSTLPRHDLQRPDGRRVFVYGELGGDFRGLRDEPEDVSGIHLRLDLMTDSWVAISPGRNARPLDSQLEPVDTEECPFCPGGLELPFGYGAAVFENRFPSLVPDPPEAPELDGPTLPARGRCEIVLYTHRHDVSFGELSPLELTCLLAVWIDRSRELWEDPAHEYVLVFENRGSEIGATISHPHGQIYAFGEMPPLTAGKLTAHRHYRASRGGCLGCEVVATDSRSARVVSENRSFTVAVPFAARWPFEVAVRARRHGLGRLADLEPEEQLDLVHALRDVAMRLDALFGFQLPYMMVAQEAPRDAPDWHLAFEFYPLYRAPEKTKIRASVETASGLFLNDLLPEDAARQLALLEVEGEPIDPSCLYVVAPAGVPEEAQALPVEG
ncbi:MAG: galactose-1-phosphate uridylyltransferase [Gaiellaceae bacterium]